MVGGIISLLRFPLPLPEKDGGQSGPAESQGPQQHLRFRGKGAKLRCPRGHGNGIQPVEGADVFVDFFQPSVPDPQ